MNKTPYEGASLPEVMVGANAGGVIEIPEARLLFEADFMRSGPDLLLVNAGDATIRVPGYFASRPAADLHEPDGAILRGDLVERLAGPIAPGQYAQAGGGTAQTPIGQVETAVGQSSVQRVDGTVETLEAGSRIYADDVIQTGSGGEVSVTFVDGTIFSLSQGSRMVIDELIYDPSATDNSATLDLIQGSFVFIAGQVARTGGMEVSTPSATMGIRGTTVIVDIQTINGILTSEVSLTRDPDGNVGHVVVRDLSGNVVADITDTNSKWLISSADGEVQELERTAQDDAEDSALIADAVAAFQSAVARAESGQGYVQPGGPDVSGNTTPPATPPSAVAGQGLAEPDAVEQATPLDEIAPPSEPSAPAVGTEAGPDATDEDLDRDFRAEDVTVEGSEDPVDGVIEGVIPGDETEEALVFALLSETANGVLVLNPDGSFEYTPDADFSGTDVFTYEVTNDRGDVETGTVTIVVAPVNDAPVLEDARFVGVEDVAIRGTVRGSDVDGDQLSYKLISGGNHGQVVLLQDGTFVYTPDSDYAGDDSFRVRVLDGKGGKDTATVFVNLRGVNDAPTVGDNGANARGSVTEDGATMTGGQLVATDPDADQILSWSGSGAGRYGTFTVTAAGKWTYALGSAAETLGAGQVVTENFIATVSDGNGGSARQSVTVRVTGRNDAAVITGSTTGTVVEDGLPEVEGKLTHTDVDLSDPDGVFRPQAAGSATDFGYGSYSVDATGRWSYSLDNTNPTVDALRPGQSLTDSFTVRSGDGTPQTITITIQGGNDPPTDTSVRTFSVDRDGIHRGSLAGGDAEGPVSFALSGAAARHGKVTLEADGSFSYVPDESYAGPDTFGYTVTDADGSSVEGVVTATVDTAGYFIGNGFTVALSTSATAADGQGAGHVRLLSTPLDASDVNLVFVLDRSGSLTPEQYTQELQALARAVDGLARQFDGFSNTFTVKIVGFASTAGLILEAGLQEAGLSAAILAIPQTGGDTNWSPALRATQDALAADGSGATNHVFFIAGAGPDDAFETALAALTDSGANGYSVRIDGFYAAGKANSELATLDAASDPLGSGDTLIAALPAYPGGRPQSSYLEISLVADGVDKGIVYAASTPSDGRVTIECTVDLADIPGLVGLLGESNVFTVRTELQRFTASGPEKQVLLRGLTLGAADAAVILDGSDDSDLLPGSRSADRIVAGAGDDVLLGYGGNDTLDGGEGRDTLFGAGGNDRLVVRVDEDGPGEVVDGGRGRDVLAFGSGGNIADLLPVLDISDVEALDMANGLANTLLLTLEDVVDMSSTSNDMLEGLLIRVLPESVVVYGDERDSLSLQENAGASIRLAADAPVSGGQGQKLTIYEYVDAGGNVLATLGVDDDIDVSIVPTN
ncbi:Ig-like domain-containing protein [Sulfitobacter sp. LCG007]